MGQEIWLYPEPSKIPEIKEYLKLLDLPEKDGYLIVEGPNFNGWEMNCWIEFRKVDWEPEYDDEGVNDFEGIEEFLEIGYQPHHYKSDFAKCIAWELRKRFKFLKAGWDSIGWADDFWKNEPFDFHIKMNRKSEKKFSDKSFLKEVERLKEIKKTCMDFAKALFENADERNGK